MATRHESLIKGLRRMKLGLSVTPCQQMVIDRFNWRTEGAMRKALIHDAKPYQNATVVHTPQAKTFRQRMAAMWGAITSVFTSNRTNR